MRELPHISCSFANTTYNFLPTVLATVSDDILDFFSEVYGLMFQIITTKFALEIASNNTFLAGRLGPHFSYCIQYTSAQALAKK